MLPEALLGARGFLILSLISSSPQCIILYTPFFFVDGLHAYGLTGKDYRHVNLRVSFIWLCGVQELPKYSIEYMVDGNMLGNKIVSSLPKSLLNCMRLKFHGQQRLF